MARRRRWRLQQIVTCVVAVILSVELIAIAIFACRASLSAEKFDKGEYSKVSLQPNLHSDNAIDVAASVSDRKTSPARPAAQSVPFSVETLSWNATFVKLKLRSSSHRPRRIYLMHITDSHLSASSSKPPFTDRMHNEYKLRRNFFSGKVASPFQFFADALDDAAKAHAFVALGGDIVNFPTEDTVASVEKQLAERKLDFCYVTGNHDWMFEGAPITSTIDGFLPWAFSERQAAILGSLSRLQPSSEGFSVHIIGGALRLIAIDNSIYGVTGKQLASFRSVIEQPHMPTVLLLHIPLYLGAAPVKTLFPLMGAADWGADSDRWFENERRPRWPSRAESSTKELLEAVQASSAPSGPLVAILSGHIHQNVSFPINCHGDCAARWRDGWEQRLDVSGQRERIWEKMPRPSWQGAMQHVTLDGSDGGYRLVELEFA